MVKINILKCCNYGEQQWLKMLRAQKSTAFHFVLPKKSRYPASRKKTILMEYYIAACIGQELDSIAEAFFYGISDPRRSHDFHFIVITKRIYELAHTLFTISSGFGKTGRPRGSFVGYVLTFHALMKLLNAGGHQRYSCKELMKLGDQFAPSDI